MKGIICFINFKGSDNIKYNNHRQLHQSHKTGLWVDKEYKGKFVWDITSGNKFILLIGTAFFRENIDKSQRLIVSKDHLGLVQKELDKGNFPENFLTGFYNLISVDETSEMAVIHNSHFGMRPLFYSKKDKQLMVATNPELIIKTGFIKGEINLGSVLQFIQFNYTLNEDSIFKHIYTLPSGSRMNLSVKDFAVKRYFDAGTLIDKPKYNHKDSIQLVHNSFNNVIKKYTDNISSFSLSLTGGWDGRLILSMLKDKNVETSCYSHGTANNPDIIIPQAICKQLGINYTPYLLNEDYYKTRFYDLAITTLDNSSCMRSVSRSHYLYSVGSEMLKNNYVFTGICGSNLMKGNIIPGPVSNGLVLKFIHERKFDTFWEFYIDFYIKNVRNYFEVSEDIMRELRISLIQIHEDYHKSDQLEFRLYRFLLNVIERKYFGNEIMTYSHLGENLSPFIDIDFIKTLTSSTFFGAYVKSNSKNIFANWKNSLLYAEMINKTHPVLGKIKSDKGVSLSDLLKVYKWPWVGVKQIQKRFSKVNRGYYDHSMGIEKLLLSIEQSKVIKSAPDFYKTINYSETMNNIISYYSWIKNRQYS